MSEIELEKRIDQAVSEQLRELVEPLGTHDRVLRVAASGTNVERLLPKLFLALRKMHEEITWNAELIYNSMLRLQQSVSPKRSKHKPNKPSRSKPVKPSQTQTTLKLRESPEKQGELFEELSEEELELFLPDGINEFITTVGDVAFSMSDDAGTGYSCTAYKWGKHYWFMDDNGTCEGPLDDYRDAKMYEDALNMGDGNSSISDEEVSDEALASRLSLWKELGSIVSINDTYGTLKLVRKRSMHEDIGGCLNYGVYEGEIGEDPEIPEASKLRKTVLNAAFTKKSPTEKAKLLEDLPNLIRKKGKLVYDATYNDAKGQKQTSSLYKWAKHYWYLDTLNRFGGPYPTLVEAPLKKSFGLGDVQITTREIPAKQIADSLEMFASLGREVTINGQVWIAILELEKPRRARGKKR